MNQSALLLLTMITSDFKFPKSDKRSEASVKVDKNSGMMEFETGNLPYLSILWTANCSEIAR